MCPGYHLEGALTRHELTWAKQGTGAAVSHSGTPVRAGHARRSKWASMRHTAYQEATDYQGDS